MKISEVVKIARHQPPPRDGLVAAIAVHQTPKTSLSSFTFPFIPPSRQPFNISMSAPVVICQSSSCPNGHPPSRLECPTCNKSVTYPTAFLYADLIVVWLNVDWASRALSFVDKNVSRLAVSNIVMSSVAYYLKDDLLCRGEY